MVLSMEEPELKLELQGTYILDSIEKTNKQTDQHQNNNNKIKTKPKNPQVFILIELYRQHLNAISVEAV